MTVLSITWISWGAAPGYINLAPLGLKGSTPVYKFVPPLDTDFLSFTNLEGGGMNLRAGVVVT
jgi:hypothetical protein